MQPERPGPGAPGRSGHHAGRSSPAARLARRFGVSDEKLFAVGAWRDSPYFTEAERIALEITEELTHLSMKPEAVSDELWERAAGEFDEAQLAALIVAVATINFYNRVNHATRQPGGSWKP